jgi:hypothetical protein
MSLPAFATGIPLVTGGTGVTGGVTTGGVTTGGVTTGGVVVVPSVTVATTSSLDWQSFRSYRLRLT